MNGTYYEIALMNVKTGERFRLVYSARKTKRVVLEALSTKNQIITTYLDPDGRYKFTSPAGFHKMQFTDRNGNPEDWELGFTGRTERQAKQEGELPPLKAK